jgi:hypothetical protein
MGKVGSIWPRIFKVLPRLGLGQNAIMIQNKMFYYYSIERAEDGTGSDELDERVSLAIEPNFIEKNFYNTYSLQHV